MLPPLLFNIRRYSLMLRLLSFVVLFACLYPLSAWAQAALTILHTNEHNGTIQPIDHGAFIGQGGVERRSTLINTIRKEVEFLLVVDSGGLFMGTTLSSAYRGEADITVMNRMGYDAIAVGNHDFDLGIRHLKNLQKEATFPFLCTNVRPKEPDVCTHHAIKTIGTTRIGLIGLIGKKNYPDTFNRTVVKEVDFQDPIVAARKAVEELRERVELLVAITHQDTEEDLALAKAIPALDVIIGGHTEGFDGVVKPGETHPQEGRVELAGTGPVFVKTHRHGRTLGRLDLVFHDRTLMVAEARNLPVTSTVPSDPEVARLVQEYVQKPVRKNTPIIDKTTQTDSPTPDPR